MKECRPSRARRWRRVLRRIAFAGGVSALLCTIVLSSLWLVYPFPVEEIELWPRSPVVTDRRGRTLLQLVGTDEQWRFPVPLSAMSRHLIDATVAVEDERFAQHFGIDPVAAARACLQNLMARRVVSGASTLTMQICRMIDDRPRTFRAKAVESFRALQLERSMDKAAILETYLNIAPYGRNLRGVEAASLFYFGKHSRDLSLGEAALLAGLPQSPERYRPDKRPELALARRETVLRRMYEAGMISGNDRRRAADEPLQVRGRQSGTTALHASWLALCASPSGGQTTIDSDVQCEIERLSRRHARDLPDDAQVAVVAIDIARAEIVAMVGSLDPEASIDGQVNGAVARRSPGSALKPFVYAAAFQAGRLSQQSILYDVPIERAGWTPSNFDRSFRGEVSAAEALRESLNIPAILVAEGVGISRCIGTMRSAGLRIPADAEARAGLGVVVGTIEVTLLDLTDAYATLGRGGERIRAALMRKPGLRDQPVRALRAEACRAVNDILSTRRQRPAGLERASDQDVPWFMWKTGTSSGRRDALAVGHNGRYAIGVWVGCFSGAGRVEFVGKDAAEPLLAKLFCLRSLRNAAADPARPEPIIVRRPLPQPCAVRAELRVLSPADGAVFAGPSGIVPIYLEANRRGGLMWFLDGELVACTERHRMSVRSGGHELRCVSEKGESDAVRFIVR